MDQEGLILYIWKHSKNPAFFQPVQAIEEMAELQKELTKFIRGRDNIDKITEEIADVELTIESLKFGLQVDSGILDDIKHEKIKRYFERVENGIYG